MPRAVLVHACKVILYTVYSIQYSLGLRPSSKMTLSLLKKERDKEDMTVYCTVVSWMSVDFS